MSVHCVRSPALYGYGKKGFIIINQVSVNGTPCLDFWGLRAAPSLAEGQPKWATLVKIPRPTGNRENGRATSNHHFYYNFKSGLMR